MPQFDYVIVGAGSAGCVLAERLSADPAVSVALLEAGGSDRHPYIGMPKGSARLMASARYMWHFMVAPEQNTAMRPDVWPRGKVLGGSSSVNGMMWTRGQPADFDGIAALSSDDWSWKHIARAYEAIENHELGPAPARGTRGPLRISMTTFRNALTEAILAAGAGMGWPVKEDVNEPGTGEVIGYVPRNIFRGKRQNAALAFLRPARRRPNLTVITGATVDRLRFEGKRASGIEFLRNGQRQQLDARREVILSAGAIASPAILERSGIGDPQRLAALGIPLVQASPQVGENALEHRAIRMQWRLGRPLSQNFEFGGWRLVRSVIRYYLTGTGPMAGAAMELRADFRSDPAQDRPDVYAMLGMFSWDMTGRNYLEKAHGFAAVVTPLRPRSKGSVHIASTDPAVLPAIAARYGSDPQDEALIVKAVRLMRRLAAQEPLAALIETETVPGPAAQSDAEILDVLHQTGNPCMHTIGTCRMGSDPESVVDPRLMVRGVDGLRVVDASIFPVMPAGNTNGPVMAMAWRTAEIIRE